MINFHRKQNFQFSDLVQIVKILRADDGCPWDRVQTHESIRRNFLEEVYEACEAIDQKDTDHLREELGDVLLHVVFHAGIETDAGHFTIDDVCDTVVKKMISRHPDLFGGEKGLSWDEIKRREKGQTIPADELDAVARSLPALWRAEKLQNKAEKAGVGRLEDPQARLEAAVAALSGEGDRQKALGELLFAAVDAARKCGMDPEEVLHARCEDFLEDIRCKSAGTP